jgi:Flp pilus assembly protein TadD
VFSKRLTAGAAALVLLAAGSWFWLRERALRQRDEGGARIIAFVPFDNLSGDSSLDWLAPELPPLVARQLERIEGARVMLAASANEAVARGATHVVTGYFEPSGGVRYVIESAARGEPAADGRLRIEPGAANALPPRLAAAVRGALKLKGSLAPFEIHTERALKAWAEGRFEEAALADPACGWCWLAWAETTARTRGPEEAAGVVARSRAHFQTLPALTRARLELLEGTLRRNEPAQRKALEQLAALGDAEPRILGALAESYTRERDFKRAAAVLRKALERDPEQPALWNTLGYAYAWMGDFEQARQSLDRYEKLAPNDANPPDSKGEVEMMAGRFAAAVKHFRASYARSAGFNQGAALEKAAIANWLQGDLAAASQTADEYLAARRRAGDLLAPFHEARWRLLLGQTAEARGQFEAMARDHGLAAALASIRLSLWSLLEGQPALSRKWAGAALGKLPTSAGPLRGVAELLASAEGTARREADPLLRVVEAISVSAGSGAGAAADVWSRARAAGAGGSDSFETEMLAAALAASRRVDEAAKVLGKSWPLLNQTQLALFDFIVLPAAVYTRAEIARLEKRDSEAVKLYDLYLRSMGRRKDQAAQLERAREFARL